MAGPETAGRPEGTARAVLVIALVLLVVILAAILTLAAAATRGAVRGGWEPRRREDVVVDTLNLVHWLKRRAPTKPKIGDCDVIEAINLTAPLLKDSFPGRITYVTKNRETKADPGVAARARALFQAAARRNNVYIDAVERLPDQKTEGETHAGLGRDDFYLIMIAHQYGCGVLSRDRFRDLADMKAGQLKPFHVYRFSPGRPAPGRDFVNPAAPEFGRMHRPATFDFQDYLPHL